MRVFFFSHSELFLPPLFHERIGRRGQSFQVRLVFVFFCFSLRANVTQPLVFFAAGSLASQPPLASSRGGPST